MNDTTKPQTRTCKACKQAYPIEMFNTKRKGWYNNDCTTCIAKRVGKETKPAKVMRIRDVENAAKIFTRWD